MDFSLSIVLAFVNALLTSAVLVVGKTNRKFAFIMAITVFVLATLLLPRHDDGGGWTTLQLSNAGAALFMAIVWVPGMLFALRLDDPEKRTVRRIFAIGTSAILGFLSPFVLGYLYFSNF